MSLTHPILTFKTGDYTITRAVPETIVNARVVPGATSTFSVAASKQPISGNTLRMLPEAEGADETCLFLCVEELRTRTDAGPSDLVAADGHTWKVIRAERWNSRGTTWTRAYISRRSNP